MIRKLGDYKQHKLAEVHLKDIENILIRLDRATKLLEGYKHYMPVKRILIALNDNCDILKVHQTKYKKQLEDTTPKKEK